MCAGLMPGATRSSAEAPRTIGAPVTPAAIACSSNFHPKRATDHYVATATTTRRPSPDQRHCRSTITINRYALRCPHRSRHYYRLSSSIDIQEPEYHIAQVGGNRMAPLSILRHIYYILHYYYYFPNKQHK
jgi:hypothetical protein